MSPGELRTVDRRRKPASTAVERLDANTREDDSAAGVALAAIQRLAKRNGALVDRLDRRDDRIDELEPDNE